MKKLYLFLTTLLLGGAIMSYKLFDTNFSSEGIQEWALDALLIAAILGFIAMKWLKHKGKLDWLFHSWTSFSWRSLMAFSPLLSWIESEIIRFHFQVCNHASAYPYPVCLFQTLVSPSCFASLFSSDFWNQVCQGRPGRLCRIQGNVRCRMAGIWRRGRVVAVSFLWWRRLAWRMAYTRRRVRTVMRPVWCNSLVCLYLEFPYFHIVKKRWFQSEWQATAKFWQSLRITVLLQHILSSSANQVF